MAAALAPAPATVASVAPDIDDGAAYQALESHDARFDGRLFVGVTSTGIYCRPVCRVKTPQRRHCRFFASAALAERAGFRPCLRCRPELAPGLAFVDAPQALAAHAVRLIDEAVGDGRDLPLPEAAAALGISDRHLRRIFGQSLGVTPLAYLATRRLLLAKQLLTDTDLPVTAVAFGSGFASLRRFNAAFAERYRMSPGALRRQRATDAAGGTREAVTVRLGYRPPYDVAGVLRFLSRRAVAGLESVEGLEWRRTLEWTHQGRRLTGWMAARFEPIRHEVELRLAPSLAPALGAVVLRVRQAMDLDADPALVEPVLAGLPHRTPGTRVIGSLSGFEAAARIVLGQQVTVAAARTLTQRLVSAFGEPVTTPWPGPRRVFPGAEALAGAPASELRRLGIVSARVQALQALAQAVSEGRLTLAPSAPLAPTLESLRALPGVGEWTAQMVAMRALAWPDAFPASDRGVLRALGTRDRKTAEELASAWRPWRAYAVMAMWQQLENER